jgi:hypothetical protein
MKKSKRGQVTIFIIIAIVIVAAITAVIFIQRTQQGLSSEIQIIKNYLDYCFEDKAKQTILDMGKQGFYYELPIASIDFLDEKTAYYFKDEQDLVPTITTIEQELSSGMDKKMLPCLALSEFRQEYDITWSNCISTAKVKQESIEFSINCDIAITKGITTSKLEEFKTNIDCNAKKLINASNFIIEQYALDYEHEPGFICLSCLGDIAEANNVEITVVPITKEVFEPEHAWFLVTDKEKQIDDQNLTLRFVTD